MKRLSTAKRPRSTGRPSRRRPSLRSRRLFRMRLYYSGAMADRAPFLRRHEAQHALEAGFVEFQRRLDPKIGDPGHFLEGHGVDETPRAIERPQRGVALAAPADEI